MDIPLLSDFEEDHYQVEFLIEKDTERRKVVRRCEEVIQAAMGLVIENHSESKTHSL